jgi:hypothetical protein
MPIVTTAKMMATPASLRPPDLLWRQEQNNLSAEPPGIGPAAARPRRDADAPDEDRGHGREDGDGDVRCCAESGIDSQDYQHSEQRKLGE